MPKKHRVQVLCIQIVLILLALWMFFVYFAVRLAIPSFANPSMITGFVFLFLAMLLETVAYEEIPLRQTNFSEEKSESAMVNRQNEPTPQARRLHEALNKRDIHNELEFHDGYKHTDISIRWARLNLEIDGKYHLTDPEHLFRDLERDSYSHLDGIDTIRIPNFYVDSDLDEIANAIAEVARKRQERGRPAKQPRKIRY
jgi:very-short-patch-repair endonuclease